MPKTPAEFWHRRKRKVLTQKGVAKIDRRLRNLLSGRRDREAEISWLKKEIAMARQRPEKSQRAAKEISAEIAVLKKEIAGIEIVLKRIAARKRLLKGKIR